MNFRSNQRDEPEINLIPFIDILLVILIFLVLTTTYSKFTELKVTLPIADAEQQKTKPREIVVAIGVDGRYAMNQEILENAGVDVLTNALARAAQGQQDVIVIISADAGATHQSVITAMDAARRAGLMQITFATQTPGARS